MILVYSLTGAGSQAVPVYYELRCLSQMTSVAVSTHHSALVCSIRWCEGEVQCLSCNHLL